MHRPAPTTCHGASPVCRPWPNDIPEGCAAGYYPERNALITLWHHAKGADVPAAKYVAIRVARDRDPDT